MKICRGTTRIVILIGAIAIKLPIINPIKGLRNIRCYLRIILKSILYGKEIHQVNGRPFVCNPSFWNYEISMYPLYFFFVGIMANIWERRLSKRSNNPLLMPTYFSLLGLVNVMKAGDPLNIPMMVHWQQILSLTSMKEAFCDGHLLQNPKNFCWVDGHLKIIDYGSRKSHAFLEKYGEKLYNSYELDYKGE